MKAVVVALTALLSSAAFASSPEIVPRRPGGGHGGGWGHGSRAYECVATKGFGIGSRTFRSVDRFEARARQEALRACMRSGWGSGHGGHGGFDRCHVRCRPIGGFHR